MIDRNRVLDHVSLYLRCALGVGFLSSVADRFGLWGAPGGAGGCMGQLPQLPGVYSCAQPLSHGLSDSRGWLVRDFC